MRIKKIKTVMKRIIFLIILITLYLSITPSTYAQGSFPETNGIALKGVDEFLALASISVWLNVDDDRERFNSNLQSNFELGLRRDGVIVGLALDFLVCELKVAQRDGLIFYSFEVKYYKPNSEGFNDLLWMDGGIATLGVINFNPKDIAQDCIDTFSNEWLKQNPNR
jgi:hypothetical protein